MNKKIVKFLAATAVLSGGLFFGCSTSDSGTDSYSNSGTNEGSLDYQKNDAARMWSRIDALGIAGYFDSLSQTENAPVINVASLVNRHCPSPALAMDENTRYLDELESLFDEGEQVKGVCGNALKLNDGQVAPLGVNLIDSMRVGTVEFWFRPNEDFYDRNARTLMGNDGARIHFFYKNGELYFQKNHHNQHFFVKGKAELKNDWNLIAGQWGDGYMSVWLNGEMVARWEHDKGYAPATRGIPFENLVVIGYKSGCCMEGAGQYTGMTTSGSFDQFRISNIPRYKMQDSVITEPDTSINDTSVVDPVPVDTLKADTLAKDSVPVDTTVTDTLAKDTTAVDTVVADTTEKDSVHESLWSLLNTQGVSRYFVDVTLPVASSAVQKCNAPALAMDDTTLYLDELETIFAEGKLVDGVCGKALSLKSGEVAPSGINLIDSMATGTVEFWFRPNDDFFDVPARTLLGNDDSRLHFFVNNGTLYFQKNHTNKHFFVGAPVNLKKDWNLIAGQWGDGEMSLWLNGEKVASSVHELGYEASSRSKQYANLLIIGYKSKCCMEGPGLSQALTTSGAYDQLRISNAARYVPQEDVVAQDTVKKDTVSFDTAYFGPVIPIDSLGTKDLLPIVVDTTSRL